MRESVSILASSTAFPPSVTPPCEDNRRFAATKSLPKRNPKSALQFTPVSPILYTSRLDNRQNLTYYTQLASKLAEHGRFDDFFMISESVVASGVKASDFVAQLNTENVASGIARMLRDGKLDIVVDVVLSGVRKLSIDPIQIFNKSVVEAMRGECKRMLARGEMDRIVNLMEALNGFHFSITKLMEPSDILNLGIKKRNPAAAIRYAQIFPHKEVLVCSIILEFGKKGDFVSALTAFEASKRDMISPSMHMYRTIIDVCGICGDIMKSRTIFEELLDCKVTPNTYIFNSLMNVNACDLNYTMNVYKQMRKLGVTADITSHNILLKSCCLAAKVDLAQEIYRDIRNLETMGALQTDVFTYSTMIKVLADSKMWKLALEVKEDMMSSGVIPNTVTWSSLISACANAGLVEKAVKLFEEMLVAGGEPNSQCFNILLHACVKACQFDRAFRLFQCWKEQDFNYIATDSIQDGTEENFAVDHQMEKCFCISKPYKHLAVNVPFRPTTSTYNIMMKACGTDYNRAKALMDEMKSSRISPNQISWSILVDICGYTGNVASAVQILRTMRETGIQPDVISYTTAIKVCVTHKNPKLAFLLFAEMKKYRVKPNMVTYNTILRARSRYGSLQEVQQCLTVYQDMRKAGYKSNDYYLKQLIEEWCEGVIQNKHKEYGQFSAGRTYFGPESLLLEKVAEHLQDNNAENLSIDLRGLTKVEARIVVLAVLRKIKENYIAGDSIKDDMLIILGVQELGVDASKGKTGVTEAIIQLLQHDLGLRVISAASKTGKDMRKGKIDPRDLSLPLENISERSCLPPTSVSPTRRPVVLQRLKVTMESLQHWLQRKSGAVN